jgi:hypothetical protein
MFKEHAETLHSIVRLIIIQVAPFRQPLGIFSSTASIVSAKQNVVWLSLNQPEAYFTCESIFWLPDAFADGGGTKGASYQGALWICSATVLCGGIRLLPEHTSTRSRLGPR